MHVPAGLLDNRVRWCMIVEKEKVAMFENEYEFDYDRIVEDTDELYDYADYSDEPDYDDYQNEKEYDCYYHNVMDELDNE